MNEYTGYQYILIDIANQAGLDKKLFEERIQWVEANMADLEALTPTIGKKEQPLYVKAVLALRKAQAGLPTGHAVGLDACCSGIQVMSALTGCVVGATSTGMVNPNVRADAYTICTDNMSSILGSKYQISRSDAKEGVMHTFYGSRKTPKRLFGEDTPELAAFYEAAVQTAPGAWELLQDLLASWKPFALVHEWQLPDGFNARCKVMTKREVRIEVDELDHATFTYEFYENEGQERGLSNAANVTHSVDGWILRSMHRRCNYNEPMVREAKGILATELRLRTQGGTTVEECTHQKISYYRGLYRRSTMADVVILPHLSPDNVAHLDLEHIIKLNNIVDQMLSYKPFALITVHDEFKAHVNNLNHVRRNYMEIMAEIAEGNLLDDLLSQLFGEPGSFGKKSNNLGALIRQSAYALS